MKKNHLKKVLALAFAMTGFTGFTAFAQMWIDTTYTIQTQYDVQYGTAVDFAGTSRVLEMDISIPQNGGTSLCGNPLMIVVHGGAWSAGSKEDVSIVKMREDFAKRGYTTAAVNYRLGIFNSSTEVNCNVSGLFNIPWNCLNASDTSEWYRANFRAIQDVKGALRFLVNNAAQYQVDPDNIFLVGESAGGFISMGVGFLDDISEVQTSLSGAYPNIAPPNAIYDGPCVQTFGFATNIASMDLSRPDLGSYEGTIESPAAVPYRIRGVGNFYGGAFNNIFQTTTGTPPALYMYHQPCDLIVPYNYAGVYQGYQDCFFGFPANCGYIYRRSRVYGSNGIKTLIDNMIANSIPAPDYLLDNTTNQWNCAEQTNANQQCHAIDNYWLRTTNMATFFAPKIGACTIGLNEPTLNPDHFSVFPNPVGSAFDVQIHGNFVSGDQVTLLSMNGSTLFTKNVDLTSKIVTLHGAHLDLVDGVYLVQIKKAKGTVMKKIVISQP